MKDSFNNELQVGDRILCVEPSEFHKYRKNQIGTVAKINCDGIIVEFDSYHDKGRYYPNLGIQTGYGNTLFKDVDKIIKLEIHTEVEYRVGDKVLCYYPTVSNLPFVGRVARELNTGEYEIIDEHRNSLLLTKSEMLFLLERKQFEVGDEVVVQKCANFELLFGEGYNQSIPARVDVISTPMIVIEMDDPSIGWKVGSDTIHSYWTLTNTKRLLPKEFSYSLPFVEYLKQHQSEIFTEQINSTEEDRAVSNELRSRQLINSFEQLDPMPRGRRVLNKPTPKLIHTYNYEPKELRFHTYKGEEYNKNNLYLGIELEISGSTKERDNEEDAREILKIIQEDAEEAVYFKHDSSINGFEIVFHPHTVKACGDYQWKRIFSTIRKLGYTNDDKKAGLHVHISRSYFGDTAQQNEALAKLVFLMYKFKKEIEPLAERKNSDYATYNTIGLETAKRNDFYGTFYWYSKKTGKYSAINSLHDDTFEIRIFNGVTDEQRLMNIFIFIENLCRVVKNTSPTDITKVKIEDFMPLSQSMEELS